MLPGVIEPWHLVLILIIALVVFGPGKLGDVGGALGRGIREFKSSMNTEETPSPDKEVKEVKTETKTSDNGKTEVTEKVTKAS